MTFIPPGPDPGAPSATVGLTYGGLFVRAGRDAVLPCLSGDRFSGWVGPQEGDWVLVVPEQSGGRVDGAGRQLPDLAHHLAGRLSSVAIAARVERDRVLRLDGWDGTGNAAGEDPNELGGYVSDPSGDPAPPGGADESSGLSDADYAALGLPPPSMMTAMDDPDPVGAHHAHEYAAACGRPEAGDELFELLAEALEVESVFESERLDSVTRLLGLPRWIVSVGSLPKDVPAGPRRDELVRLGAGRTGAGGRVAGRVAGVLRRRGG